MNNKNGLSSVVATVLLIMMTVAAASMLFFFVVPWLKGMMSDSVTCNKFQDQISIEEGGYTCFNEANTMVMIKRGFEPAADLESLKISLVYNGTSSVYDISNGTDGSAMGVRMYSGASTLKLPVLGGAETYVFPVSADSVNIIPIANGGKTCGSQAVFSRIVSCSTL